MTKAQEKQVRDAWRKFDRSTAYSRKGTYNDAACRRLWESYVTTVQSVFPGTTFHTPFIDPEKCEIMQNHWGGLVAGRDESGAFLEPKDLRCIGGPADGKWFASPPESYVRLEERGGAYWGYVRWTHYEIEQRQADRRVSVAPPPVRPLCQSQRGTPCGDPPTDP